MTLPVFGCHLQDQFRAPWLPGLAHPQGEPGGFSPSPSARPSHLDLRPVLRQFTVGRWPGSEPLPLRDGGHTSTWLIDRAVVCTASVVGSRQSGFFAFRS